MGIELPRFLINKPNSTCKGESPRSHHSREGKESGQSLCPRRHGGDLRPPGSARGSFCPPRCSDSHLRDTFKDLIFGQFCRDYNLQGTLILASRPTKTPDNYAHKIIRLENCPLTSFIHSIIEGRGSQPGSLLLAFTGSGFHLEMQLPLLF